MKDFIHRFAVGMVGLLETKVKTFSLGGLTRESLWDGASHLMQVTMVVAE